jgi:aldehyde dehydrogenase (NAD+)
MDAINPAQTSDRPDIDLAFARTSILIDNVWHEAASRGTMPIEDPSYGDVIGEAAAGDAADVDAAVAAARRAADGEWGASTALDRGRILQKLSARILDHAEWLAQLEARDVGKPIGQARADVVALARYCEFYAGAADKLHGQTIPFQAGYTVYTRREPHGVTGHIIPWNYPMQIIGRSVIAALVTGNAAVLKPAEQTVLTSVAFARLAIEAGLPAGALNVVTGFGGSAGAALSAHAGVDHVSFTGSTRTGVAIQQAAALNARPVTLELGGKSPQIVFADADLDRALPFLVNASIQNAGQTCSAGSRLIVHRAILDEVCSRLAKAFAALRAGPALRDLPLGPLVSATQKAVVERYVALGRAELELVAEGRVVDDAPAGGHYVPPALFVSPPDHALAREEIFGPVPVVIPFDDEAEAIAIANGTAYGLVASVWTADASRLLRLPAKLRAGQVFLNNYGAAGGVELPFGGVGHSGHGREKGFEALYGFTTVKTVAAWHG